MYTNPFREDIVCQELTPRRIEGRYVDTNPRGRERTAFRLSHAVPGSQDRFQTRAIRSDG